MKQTFPFGTNNPYYSRREPESQVRDNTIGLSKLFGTGAALFALGTVPAGQGNVFDLYYKTARVAGHFTPFGLLSSLRIPEMLSPFTSSYFQSGGGGNVVNFGAEYLANPETLRYLSRVSNVPESTLRSYGIGSGSSLKFERDIGVHGALGRGTLSAVEPSGAIKTLSKNMSLLERSHTYGDIFSPRTNINQFASGVVSLFTQDIRNPQAFANRLFATTDPSGKTLGSHRFMPIPSISGEIGSMNEAISRVSFFRGYSAFSAQRLNKAIQTMSEGLPVFGEALQPWLRKVGAELPDRPALKMYGGYAGFAAKLGIAAGAVSYYNWFLRYQSDDSILKREATYAVGAGAIGGLTSWLSRGVSSGHLSGQLRSMNPRVAQFASIAAFIGQNVLPGFDKGIYSGISNTFTNLNIARAEVGEATGISSYKRKLEETFPGITSFSFGIATGGVGYLGAELLLPGQNRYRRFFEHLNRDLAPHGGAISIFNWRTPNKLDSLYEAWEKVSYNLNPGDDLALYKNAVKAGHAPKPTLPFQAQNEAFETALRGNTTSRFNKAGLIIDHLKLDKNARWKSLSLGGVLLGAGILAQQIVTSGIFGSSDTPDELRKEAVGERWVPVRSSRGWGMGGTPFAGGKISYYKPSTNALITSDATNRSVWGDDVENISPMGRWFKKNFTHHLEDKNYYNRPYPMTSPAFSDIPIAGDILGSTIGQIIKPTRYQFQDQWIRASEGGDQYLTVPNPMNSNPSIKLGGTGMGQPLSPFSVSYVASQTQYKLRELQGLLGFGKNVLQEAFTGSETFIPNSPILASSADQDSTNKLFWDLNLGGSFGLSELPRRFLPKDRLETREKYNPIYNQMPNFIPEEFRRGDPYTKKELGSVRLPGAGFEALFPELKGLSPEEYPLEYRYRILGNISPYSDEFLQVKIRAKGLANRGKLSQNAIDMIAETDRQIDSQRQKRNFYTEGPENLDDSQFQRASRNAYIGAISMVKNLAAPLEYLSPGGFRPFQKFLPPGTALDDYERYSLYGSETSFWKPSASVRDYFRPALYSTMRLFGYNLVPEYVEEKRAINQYFDKLTYYKYMNLAIDAKQKGDGFSAKEYEKYAHKTVYGINPFGNPLSIYSILPDAEKTHYDAFLRATPKERERLWQILPEDQKGIFAAQWAKIDQKDIPISVKQTQGLSDQYYAEYQNSEIRRFVSYPDYVRLKELEPYFENSPPPQEEWAAWHSDADLKDVKLKFIENAGYSIHEFNMWQNQKMQLARKPYLEGTEQDIQISSSTIRNQFSQLYSRTIGTNYSNYFVESNTNSFLPSSSVNIVLDNREKEIRKQLRNAREQ